MTQHGQTLGFEEKNLAVSKNVRSRTGTKNRARQQKREEKDGYKKQSRQQKREEQDGVEKKYETLGLLDC